MEKSLLAYRGINPGLFLENELKKRKIPKSRFALSINEYPQTFVSITKGKRKLNLNLALKIEHELNFEEGSLMMLQLYYDIQQFKLEKSSQLKPDLSKLREILFWDTNFSKINWVNQAESIIKRVYERGNETEKQEIDSFYGKAKVLSVLKRYKLRHE